MENGSHIDKGRKERVMTTKPSSIIVGSKDDRDYRQLRSRDFTVRRQTGLATYTRVLCCILFKSITVILKVCLSRNDYYKRLNVH